MNKKEIRARLVDAAGGGLCPTHGEFIGTGKYGLKACPFCDIDEYHRQQREETPLIDRTYDVILPSGRRAKVNIFDMNLAMACGGEKYIQLEDAGWIQAKRLKIIPKAITV